MEDNFSTVGNSELKRNQNLFLFHHPVLGVLIGLCYSVSPSSTIRCPDSRVILIWSRYCVLDIRVAQIVGMWAWHAEKVEEERENGRER